MSKKKKSLKYAESSLLNKRGHHSIAAIASEITIETTGYSYGNLTISDCNRSIHLCIDCETEEEIENANYKLDTIIEICKSTKKFIKDNKKEIFKRRKERKENKDE